MSKFCLKVFRGLYYQGSLMVLVYILLNSVWIPKDFFHHTQHVTEPEVKVTDIELNPRLLTNLSFYCFLSLLFFFFTVLIQRCIFWFIAGDNQNYMQVFSKSVKDTCPLYRCLSDHSVFQVLWIVSRNLQIAISLIKSNFGEINVAMLKQL